MTKTSTRPVDGLLPWHIRDLADFSVIGFEAGDANLYRYVGNSPTNATDPSGLIKVTRLGSEKAPAIGKLLYVDWDFELENPSPENGWLVQRNIVYRTTAKCQPNEAKDVIADKLPLERQYEFWEAWPVLKGQTKAQSRTDAAPPGAARTYTDRTAMKINGINTVGHYLVVGEIRFFLASDTVRIERLKDKKGGLIWDIGLVPDSADLFSTRIQPPWWNTGYVKDEPIATRWFRVKWIRNEISLTSGTSTPLLN